MIQVCEVAENIGKNACCTDSARLIPNFFLYIVGLFKNKSVTYYCISIKNTSAILTGENGQTLQSGMGETDTV